MTLYDRCTLLLEGYTALSRRTGVSYALEMDAVRRCRRLALAGFTAHEPMIADQEEMLVRAMRRHVIRETV
jgi:hypothetical protein